MNTNSNILHTERLILRPLELTDAQDIFEYASDPEFKRFTPYIPDDYSFDDAVAYIESRRSADWNAEPTFGVELAGKVIGMITLRVDSENAVGMGWGTARPHWGQGIAPEAVMAAIKWAISNLGVRLIYATADVENPASVRVMQKLGMVDVTDDGTPTLPGRSSEVRYEISAEDWLANHPDAM